MELTLIALVRFNQGLSFCEKRRELGTQQKGKISCWSSSVVEELLNKQEQQKPRCSRT